MREAVTVTQLNRYIKDMFAQNNLLYNVAVKGEISNFKESKGNFYFSLKDESSTISCIMFSNNISNCVGCKIIDRDDDTPYVKDGMKVTIVGRISVYERNGTYSIYVNQIENAGLGEYYIKLMELKKKLSDMGMFDDSYKQEINKYSSNIGVVTSGTGAAIEDIKRTIYNKNPYARIVLYPSLVQGDNAYQSIINGIITLDNMGLDVIIIGRGGGSIEDLYAFNDERVAYAIFNAKTPIISAVGHEINDSISDLVADKRVATPTAAAMEATFDYGEFEQKLIDYREILIKIVEDKILDRRERLDNKKMQLNMLSPKAKVARYKEKLALDKDSINEKIKYRLDGYKDRLKIYIEKLKTRDILDKLSRGLTYVTDNHNKKVSSIKDLKVNEIVHMRFKDGTAETKITKVY